MNTGIRSLCSIGALALLMTGCLQDLTPPEIIIDHLEPNAFEAVSANGHPLPASFTSAASTPGERQLTRASLVLSAPDSLRLILLTQSVAANGALGTVVHDTLRARLGPPDSVIVLSPMGTYPLRLVERMRYTLDGTLILTVTQPLPSSTEAVGVAPLEIQFRSVEYRP